MAQLTPHDGKNNPKGEKEKKSDAPLFLFFSPMDFLLPPSARDNPINPPFFFFFLLLLSDYYYCCYTPAVRLN
jgi:hypothetical protein